jgi:hypothetical protein
MGRDGECLGCYLSDVRQRRYVVRQKFPPFPSDTHLVLLVAFLSFSMRDPLLCLTASITVRERPVSMTPARAALASMLKEAGGLPESQPSVPIVSFDDEIDKSYRGLDEVNLLWGLSSGTHIFSSLIVSHALSTYSPDFRKCASFPPQHADRCQNT